MIRIVIVTLADLLNASTAPAQPDRQPYAGQEIRALKALSDAEIGDLLTRVGMGFAKVAE